MMCSCLTPGLLCVWNDVLHLPEVKLTNLSSERLHSSEHKRQNKDCERHAASSKFALRNVHVLGVIGSTVQECLQELLQWKGIPGVGLFAE